MSNPTPKIKYRDERNVRSGVAAEHGGSPTKTITPSGSAPGSPEYFGQTTNNPAHTAGTRQPALNPRIVGEPPGSPSYFGHGETRSSTYSEQRSSAPHSRIGTREAALSPKAVGEPPGSPSYFGSSGSQATEHATYGSPSRDHGPYQASVSPSAPSRSRVSVGHPPGSAAYYGRVEGADYSGAVSPGMVEQSDGRSSYGGARSGATSRPSGGRALTPLAVGDPPGSPAYFGHLKAKAHGVGSR